MGLDVRGLRERLGHGPMSYPAFRRIMIARVIYGMITTGKAYNENEAFKQTPVTKARRLKYLIKQAQSLGYTLAPAA